MRCHFFETFLLLLPPKTTSPKVISHVYARECSKKKKNAVKLNTGKDESEDGTRRIKESHAVWDERKLTPTKECSQAEETRKEGENKYKKREAPPDIVSYINLFLSPKQLPSLVTCQHFFLLIPVHMPVRTYIISHSARSALRKHRDCASRCRQSPGSLCSRGSRAGECCRSC